MEVECETEESIRNGRDLILRKYIMWLTLHAAGWLMIQVNWSHWPPSKWCTATDVTGIVQQAYYNSVLLVAR